MVISNNSIILRPRKNGTFKLNISDFHYPMNQNSLLSDAYVYRRTNLRKQLKIKKEAYLTV